MVTGWGCYLSISSLSDNFRPITLRHWFSPVLLFFGVPLYYYRADKKEVKLMKNLTIVLQLSLPEGLILK